MGEISGNDLGRLEGKIDALTASVNASSVANAGRMAKLEAESREFSRRIDEVAAANQKTERELDDFKTAIQEAFADVAKKSDIKAMRDSTRWFVGIVVTGFASVTSIVLYWISH